MPGNKDIETLTPNTRLGVTFMDMLNQGHAAKDEVMLDKEAGDLAYRRKDGRKLWYSQENLPLYTFMSQLRSRADAYAYYKRPDDSTSVYNDSYFMTCLMDVKDWTFKSRPDDVEPSLLNGDTLLNLFPDAFSISQEGNGFFVQLNIAPKDLAFVNLLNARYNMEYEYYAGMDEEKQAKHALYEAFNYAASQVIVNYTVTWYDLNGEEKMSETGDGYVTLNEVSFIPFAQKDIFSRGVVGSTKLRINHITAPKLAEGLALCDSPADKIMVRAVRDTHDLSFQTMNMSFFFTATDDGLYLPNWVNHTEILLLMGLKEYENALARSAGSGGGGGIVTSILEPDEKTWKTTNLWIELMRHFDTDTGESVYTGAETTMTIIEEALAGIVRVPTNLSFNIGNVKDFYVKKTGPITIGGEE